MESVKWGPVFKKNKSSGQHHDHGNNLSRPMSAGSFSNRYLERGRMMDLEANADTLFYRDQFFDTSFETGKPLQNGHTDRYKDLNKNFERTNQEDYDDVYDPVDKQSGNNGSVHKTNENQSIHGSTVQEEDHRLEHLHQNFRKIDSPWHYLDLKNRKQTGDLYRAMATITKKEKSRIFAFASSRPREGVSTVLVNLVSYMNEQLSGKRVLIIDANLQAPSLHRLFNMPGDCYGLMDIFSGRVNPDHAIVQISASHFLLCSGGLASNGFKNVMDQDGLNHLFAYCRKYFDYILVDTPPVLSSPDSLTIASAVDKVFLVIQYAKVQRPVAEKSKAMLYNNECQIAGVILNYVKQVIPGWVYKFI